MHTKEYWFLFLPQGVETPLLEVAPALQLVFKYI